MIYSEEEIMGLLDESTVDSPLKAVEKGGTSASYPEGHVCWWICQSTYAWAEDPGC